MTGAGVFMKLLWPLGKRHIGYPRWKTVRRMIPQRPRTVLGVGGAGGCSRATLPHGHTPLHAGAVLDRRYSLC